MKKAWLVYISKIKVIYVSMYNYVHFSTAEIKLALVYETRVHVFSNDGLFTACTKQFSSMGLQYALS